MGGLGRLRAPSRPSSPRQFFAKGDPTAALLSTLAVFAVGFVMRPIGGAVLGAYADRHGRKKGLTLTIGLMAGAAFVIAVCPDLRARSASPRRSSCCSPGWCRASPPAASSAPPPSFLVESAAPRPACLRRFVAAGLGRRRRAASPPLHGLRAHLDRSATPPWQSWGWRVAFIVGGLLGLVGLWLRVSRRGDRRFRRRPRGAAARSARNPLVGMFVEHPRAALRVVGITIAGTLLYYMWISYMPGYAARGHRHPAQRRAAWPTPSPSPTSCACCRSSALLSDRYGRKPTHDRRSPSASS